MLDKTTSAAYAAVSPAGSLGHENEAERPAKPKSGDAPTRRCHHCPAFTPGIPLTEMRITPQCRCSAPGRRGRGQGHRQRCPLSPN